MINVRPNIKWKKSLILKELFFFWFYPGVILLPCLLCFFPPFDECLASCSEVLGTFSTSFCIFVLFSFGCRRPPAYGEAFVLFLCFHPVLSPYNAGQLGGVCFNNAIHFSLLQTEDTLWFCTK